MGLNDPPKMWETAWCFRGISCGHARDTVAAPMSAFKIKFKQDTNILACREDIGVPIMQETLVKDRV